MLKIVLKRIFKPGICLWYVIAAASLLAQPDDTRLQGDGRSRLGYAIRSQRSIDNPDTAEFKRSGDNASEDVALNKTGAPPEITIRSSLWKSWWSYALYAAFALGLLYAVRRYELNRQRLKHNLELEQIELAKYKELDRLKSRFFANISHEFRTPLTLIKGPIERWLPKMVEAEMQRDFEMTQRNSRRLLLLINQLLDISRLESGKMKLQARPENIIELTRRLTMAFESLASVKEIELRFTAPEKSLPVYLDGGHYEKIITNLLSNALKFTPSRGIIEVEVVGQRNGETENRRWGEKKTASASVDSEKGECVYIKIRDTGVGIHAECLPHIFDRFYQVGDSYAKEPAPLDKDGNENQKSCAEHYPTGQGSGIGLALTKELVELHHGEISLESEVGKGTEFTIRLPLGKAHLKPEEIEERRARGEERMSDFDDLALALANDASPRRDEQMTDGTQVLPHGKVQMTGGACLTDKAKMTAKPNDKQIILIVEDNPDMRAYIREILVHSYQIVEAADGKSGFGKAVEIIPDIIISDVMMPEMDGFQFCEKIKTDERASHIPVILLTAKSSGKSKLEGLETGADDYLIKPFDAAELKVRVKNLIEQRRKLRERFRQEITLEPKEIAITSADAKFLQRIIDKVEQNIEETDFGVTELSNA
jgi:signal transduction histidine kinase/DNA-binding response OmpR family regulator